jgi:hypothetical protein
MAELLPYLKKIKERCAVETLHVLVGGPGAQNIGEKKHAGWLWRTTRNSRFNYLRRRTEV